MRKHQWRKAHQMLGNSVMLKKNEEFIDAMIGKDEDLDEDSARAILSLYSVDVDSLTTELKKTVRATLGELSEDSKEAHNLRRILANVVKYEKDKDLSSIKPKDYINAMMNTISTAFPKPVYSFRNRSEGELPIGDKNILDGLAKELEDDCE